MAFQHFERFVAESGFGQLFGVDAKQSNQALGFGADDRERKELANAVDGLVACQGIAVTEAFKKGKALLRGFYTNFLGFTHTTHHHQRF